MDRCTHNPEISNKELPCPTELYQVLVFLVLSVTSVSDLIPSRRSVIMVSWLTFHVVYFIQVRLPKVRSPLANLFNITTDVPAFMMIQEHHQL